MFSVNIGNLRFQNISGIAIAKDDKTRTYIYKALIAYYKHIISAHY